VSKMGPLEFLPVCKQVRAEVEPAFLRLGDLGFQLVEHRGFYPRVRAERARPWLIGIDFWMCLDEVGKYRKEWSRTAPFELNGAAAIDRLEGEELIRYWRPEVLYSSRPYDVAVRTLESDLLALAKILEGWSEEKVVATGQRVHVRQSGRT
jgi:hypothetical protein